MGKIIEKIKSIGKWTKKKVIALLIVCGILGVASAYSLPEDPPPDLPIEQATERFDWQNYPELENTTFRTYNTKVFLSEGKMIQSLGDSFHYFDGTSFQDKPNLQFPEGKEITSKADRHYMMDLPEWCNLEVGKKNVRCYDQAGELMYEFVNPRVNSKGATSTEASSSTQAVAVPYDEAEFVVENHKLYFDVPDVLVNSMYPLEAYDHISTSSTNNKDAVIQGGGNADVQYGTSTNFNIGEAGTVPMRALLSFTLAADPGDNDITTVKLYAYQYINPAADITADLHELTTHTDWIEAEVTWNSYKDANAWTGGGAEGDYGGDIVDTTTLLDDTIGWYNWVCMGAGATNPMTLDWEDPLHVIIKKNNEVEDTSFNYFYAKDHETAATRPYVEITFEAAATPSVPSQKKGSVIVL